MMGFVMLSLDRPPLDLDRLAPLAGPGGAFGRIEVVDTSPSTNADLVAAVRLDPAAWPAPAALVAEHQTAGRGRAGRTWETPSRAALTVSVLLRPAVPAASLGWLPLIAGPAVVRSLPDDVRRTSQVKWPNDVVVRVAGADADPLGTAAPNPYGPGRRKIAGILAEVVPASGDGLPAVVLGIGLNVSQAADELPVPTATSLALAGVRGLDRTALLVRLLTEVSSAVGRWEAAGGDVAAAGLDVEYAAMSATLGVRVRAEVAGGTQVLEGEALRLDPTGALVVRTDDGEEHAVAAGDVHHLR